MKKRNRPDEQAMGNSPVIRYVNMVIADMIVRDETERRLDNMNLPILEYRHKLPVEPPEFAPVANRLKIMSGLNPVKYQEPVDGTVDLTFGGEPYALNIHFEDQSTEPFCVVTIEQMGSQHPPAA